MKRPMVLLLNLPGFGCHSTSKMAACIYIYIKYQISRHVFVCNYSFNVLAKFDENWSNLHTL